MSEIDDLKAEIQRLRVELARKSALPGQEARNLEIMAVKLTEGTPDRALGERFGISASRAYQIVRKLHRKAGEYIGEFHIHCAIDGPAHGEYGIYSVDESHDERHSFFALQLRPDLWAVWTLEHGYAVVWSTWPLVGALKSEIIPRLKARIAASLRQQGYSVTEITPDETH